MAGKLKLFALGGTPPPLLPREWAAFVGARQGSVIAFAYSKADASLELTARGIDQYTADYFTKRGRVVRGGWSELGDTWRSVIKLGTIDVTRRGVYCSDMSMVNGSVVARVNLDGSLTAVARIRYDRAIGGRGLYAEVP
jgi:hypothetical protein